MEHTFLKWILGVTLFYAIFMFLWKRFWDEVDPPPKPPRDKKP